MEDDFYRDDLSTLGIFYIINGDVEKWEKI